MSYTINTNVTSLQAQDYLRINADFYAKTINRVTSGLRIVASGDDAAGLAIANAIRSDRAVLTQGIRNANDGLSTLQTIDGGINNISKLLDRARTLAAQSASGTFEGNREVLNQEFQSVLTEIDRQAKVIGLNQGGDFARTLSVFIGGGRGATSSETITNGSVEVDLSQSAVDARSLGLSGYSVSSNSSYDLSVWDDGSPNDMQSALNSQTSMTFNLSGVGFDDLTVTVNLNGVQDLEGLVNAINAGIETVENSGTSGAVALRSANIRALINADGKSFSLVSATTAYSVEAGADQAALNLFNRTAAANVWAAGGLEARSFNWVDIGAGNSQRITITAVDDSGAIRSIDVDLDGATGANADTAADTINNRLQNSGVAALRKIVVSEAGSGANRLVFYSTAKFKVVVHAGSASEGVNGGTATTAESVTNSSTETTLNNSNGANLSIATKEGAEQAVSALADAVRKLGEAQAAVGKGQNQLNFAISLAYTQLNNLAASESRIRDADLAAEAANLTKAQILQQAGIAALAQANVAPQAVLSLLRG